MDGQKVVCLFLSLLLSFVLCQEEVYIEYSVLEEQPMQTFIGNVASDAGLNDRYSDDVVSQLRFHFLLPSEYFEMESHSGLLWTAQSLDRDTICPFSTSCELRLDIAVQPLTHFQIIKVRIQLDDLNDNRPTFDQERISLEISETTMSGATFALPSAQDLDSGRYGVKGYALRSSTDTFDLQVTEGNQDSKEVHLVVKERLDRESQDFYTLTLIASDGGVPPKSGSVAIDIAVMDANDNNPSFSNSSYQVYINENIARHSVIIQLLAYDPDEGQNGQVVYEFSRNTQDTYGHLFHINEDNGKVSVIGSIDYEMGNEYNLAVVARDRGPSALAAYTKVIVKVWDINDHAPDVTVNTMTSSGNAEIMEGARAGTFVAHISVSDPDGGRNGQFSCILDNTDFQLEKLYQTEFKLVTTTVFDREQQAVHSVNIICEDNGRLVQSSTRNIPVIVLDDNDHSPYFSLTSYSVELKENNDAYENITQVTASDEDLGLNAAITYTVYDEDGYQSSYVSIDDRTGVVKARVKFDYEQRTSYQFVVVATDQGLLPLSATTTLTVQVIDINDEPPRFYEDMYHFQPLENQPEGIDIGTVEAYDMDTYPYNIITYSLSPASPEQETFQVDKTTGRITSLLQLDREFRSKYILIIAAENEDYYLSSTVLVSVLVADVNDNAPLITFPSAKNNTAQVPVSSKRGDEVAAIKALDEDVGPNGALTYKITEQDVQGLFLVDPHHGVISANRDLRDYADQTFDLVILVEDHGTPSLSSSEVLTVYVNSTLSKPETWSLDQNFVIIICLASLALVLVLIVVLVVALLRRRREQQRRNHRYNCRVEATKALVTISTENNKNEAKINKSNISSNNGRDEEMPKKGVSFNLNDNKPGFGERQRPMWPGNGTLVVSVSTHLHFLSCVSIALSIFSYSLWYFYSFSLLC